MISEERRAECARVRAAVLGWAESRPDIRAVAIVGSWARDEPRMESDLDVVVLTDGKSDYVDSDDWIEAAVTEAAPVVRRMEWGPWLTERRVRLDSGLEVEFGFAPLSWASTDPVDPGTSDVVRDGCIALYDPDGIVAELLASGL
jgi:predicted nucleotidyltransferase